MGWIDFKEIYMQIRFSNLATEENEKTPLFEEEFCDLLNEYPEKYKINIPVKLKDAPTKDCNQGFMHELKYVGKRFYTITTIPISKI